VVDAQPVVEEAVALPVAEAKPAAAATIDDDANAEWKQINLELRSDDSTDVDLEQHKDD
jgi:hypothetical protein